MVGRGHAERLVPMIGELLAENDGVRIDAMLVDCGPGSFTGIRVGLAAARAFGFAWHVPVRGYCSTTVLAAACDGQADVAVAITGGHGEVFVQRFGRSPLVPLTALASLLPQDAAQVVSEGQIVGSGAASVIAARGWGRAISVSPRAADARLLPPDFAGLPPAPLYGRPPDAKPLTP